MGRLETIVLVFACFPSLIAGAVIAGLVRIVLAAVEAITGVPASIL